MRQFKKVDEKLSAKASAEKFAQAGAELADLKVALRDLKVVLRDMEFKSAGYRVHSRSLSRDDLKTLLVDWSEPLGLRHTSHTIGYLANKITALEEQCVGRLATTSQTMIARILAAQSLSLSSQTLRILEIGVLFGVASICFRKLCAPYFRDISLTLLDPFEGYYEQDVADLITGVPVSREALEENILNPTAQHADYEVISGFSHDPAIVSQLEGREFDLLLIDGDHSYEGVKKDYELYAPMVREGGIILFDDYDVAEWPDIKRFVDEGPAKSDHLEFVKYGFRTAAFRVKSRDRGA
ncbi:MAG: class I SAM-dependent methyltransferase [Pseudomonadota bacterium]